MTDIELKRWVEKQMGCPTEVNADSKRICENVRCALATMIYEMADIQLIPRLGQKSILKIDISTFLAELDGIKEVRNND